MVKKIQEIAADDHSEVRLKSSLEAALGIQYINQLSGDMLYLKNDERKGFVEISDDDLEFKQMELKKEKTRLSRKKKEHADLSGELDQFRHQYDEARTRFQAIFNAEPETRELLREKEKNRIQKSNRLAQLENEIKGLSESVLPFSIAGAFFDEIKHQIEAERETAEGEAIKAHAGQLAQKIVRVVEEPEPIYRETLSHEKMQELEVRIYKILKEGTAITDVPKILNLSERDAARMLFRMEQLENSDVFLIRPLLEEKQEIEAQIRTIEASLQTGAASESEKELFDQLQSEMESCTTQIGRKTEQLRILEEDILVLEKRLNTIEEEIEKLYERHDVSKEKADFINECDAIAGC